MDPKERDEIERRIISDLEEQLKKVPYDCELNCRYCRDSIERIQELQNLVDKKEYAQVTKNSITKALDNLCSYHVTSAKRRYHAFKIEQGSSKIFMRDIDEMVKEEIAKSKINNNVDGIVEGIWKKLIQKIADQNVVIKVEDQIKEAVNDEYPQIVLYPLHIGII